LDAAPILLLPIRITPRKNIELALHMLAELKRYFPQAMLVITGPLGPHSASNQQYFKMLLELRTQLNLKSSVHFLVELTDSFLSDKVIADFYRIADLLFLPSREEGFGIPILEAGLARLPVFCSDIPPLRSLGKDHATYFSPDADPGELASVIAKQLSIDSAYGLRAEIRRQYPWERIYSEKISPLLE
jgi:mannosylglucosylglycerate synthase